MGGCGELTKGIHIDFAHGSQSNIWSQSYSSGDKALGESGSGKYYYAYISAVRWQINLRTDYNLFGTPVYYAVAQKWNGESWENYGSERRVDGSESRPSFSDDGSNCHIWRLRYRSYSGQFLEYLYGSAYIRGYAYGTEATYNDNIRGNLLRICEGVLRWGKSYKKDWTPTDPNIYSIYNTKQNKGSPMLASLGDNRIAFQEI